MVKSYFFFINKLFQVILKQKYFINNLKFKIWILNYTKKYFKILLKFYLLIFAKIQFINNYNNLIKLVINIIFDKSNTLLNIGCFSGKLWFYYSSGNFFYKGKSKKARLLIFKSMLNILKNKLKFLHNYPIALHLKNVQFMKNWIITKLKNKFFIKTIRNFNLYSYNGCRLKKLK